MLDSIKWIKHRTHLTTCTVTSHGKATIEAKDWDLPKGGVRSDRRVKRD